MEQIDDKKAKTFDFINAVRAKNNILINSASISEISSLMGMSKKKVKKEISEMYENKTGKLKAVVNYSALGLSVYFLLVKPKDMKDTFRIMDELSKIIGIFPVYIASNSGMIITCKARTNSANLDELLIRIDSSLKGRIDPIIVIPAKKIYFEESVFKKDCGVYKVDEKDCIILSELVKNGFSTLKQIGKIAGLSEPSVYSRIKRLKEKGVLLGYSFFLDWQNAPKKFYTVNTRVIGRIDSTQVRGLFEWLANDEKNRGIMRYFYETYGEMNISFNIVVGNMFELQEFIHRITEKFSFIDLEVAPLINVRWNKRWGEEAPFSELLKSRQQ